LPAADIAKLSSRNSIQTGSGNPSSQAHPGRRPSTDLELPHNGHEQRIPRIWVWSCDNCGHSAGMTLMIGHCPECNHHRCIDCQLAPIGNSSSYEMPQHLPGHDLAKEYCLPNTHLQLSQTPDAVQSLEGSESQASKSASILSLLQNRPDTAKVISASLPMKCVLGLESIHGEKSDSHFPNTRNLTATDPGLGQTKIFFTDEMAPQNIS
jgi:hypothetical protein